MSWIQTNAFGAQKHFDAHPEEEAFIKYLGEVFQITYAASWSTGQSEYSYYLLKPYQKPSQRYGLHGEILALYAPYSEVQARSLIDVYEIQQKYKERVHPVWSILITDDPNTRDNLKALTAGKDLESYSIPFSRQELEAKPQAEFIHSRLEEFVHGRDLFEFQSALQSDTFFFGRKGIVDSIISQVENGQNFGLFGLRRTGKTSVLLAVERYLAKLGDYLTIHVDCQLPSVYLMRWNALIAKICEEITGQPIQYRSDIEQVELFERIVSASRQKILLIFDEVENISVDLSPSEHWNNDFVYFWGSVRAIHQTSRGKLTFGVAGVNPHIFDIPLVSGRDNPILLGVSPKYLWPLDEQAVRDMVRTISRYMGLDFDEAIYQWLFEQYGGHPLLTRKVCSLVCQKTKKKSGDTVVLDDFTSRQSWLDDQLGRDILNMLVVLVQHYPDEYDNLCLLAKGDQEWIQIVNRDDPATLSHLIEYRVLCEENHEFRFVVGALQRFLATRGEQLKSAVRTLSDSSLPTSYNNLPEPNQLELWTRIGRARNSVEPNLRTLLHRALIFKYSEKSAYRRVMEKFSPEKQRSLAGYSLSEIFSGQSKALYLKDVKEIALREWQLIEHIFGDRKAFEIRIDMLNESRWDAHANPVNADSVLEIEAIAKQLNDQMRPYLN